MEGDIGLMAKKIWDHLLEHRKIELPAFSDMWQLDANGEELMNEAIYVLSGCKAVREIGENVWELAYVCPNLYPELNEEWVSLTDEQVSKCQKMPDDMFIYVEDPGCIVPPEAERKNYRVVEQGYMGSRTLYKLKLNDDSNGAGGSGGA